MNTEQNVILFPIENSLSHEMPLASLIKLIESRFNCQCTYFYNQPVPQLMNDGHTLKFDYGAHHLLTKSIASSNWTPQQISELRQLLIHFWIPHINNLERSETLATFEKQMFDQNSFHSETERHRISSTEFSFVVLEGPSSDVNFKRSVDLHHQSGRNMLVQFSDICRSIDKLRDIETLGAVSIYIDDLESISAKSLSLVLQYLTLQDFSQDHPVFYISVVPTLESLTKKLSLSDPHALLLRMGL